MTSAVVDSGSGDRPDDPQSGATAADMLDALWGEVVGQPQLVGELRAAAADPVQAYLLVGPEGSGKRAAATAFAAELVARGLDETAARRAVSLAGGGVHPSVHLVERVGANISVGEAREVVKAAARAPSEGNLQIFILDEFHLVHEAAPTLLKVIEEPERGTMFVVLAEEVTEGLVTIASRCAQYTLPPVPVDAVRERLTAEGIEPEVALQAARRAGGSFRRAQLLAGDSALVTRSDAWNGAPSRLDGTGATLCVVADELLELIEGVLEPIAVKHEEEVAAFEEMVETTGDPARGRRKAMEDRHKREARRLRTDELISGALALLGSYRQAVTEGSDAATEAYVKAAAAVKRQ
jgi:DNA polymerase-3 subunit delta'